MSAAQPRWGFHRLAEPRARELVHAAGIARGDLVLDIGAGDGAITTELLAAGARVVAVELHPARASRLRGQFRDQPVTVVQADAADLRLPRRPFRVVANPPFAVTTALLRRLLAPGSRLLSADLVLPLPAATRWAAGRGPGAQRWERLYELRVVRPLPRSAFVPPSPGAVAVLRIERRRGRADPHAPPARARTAPVRRFLLDRPRTRSLQRCDDSPSSWAPQERWWRRAPSPRRAPRPPARPARASPSTPGSGTSSG